MFRNLTWLPIGLAAVLVVAGCNSPNVRDGGAAPGSTAVASGSAAVGPSQSATPSVAHGEEAASPDPVASVVLPEAGVLPRSLAYGILMWTVREAAITNQDPNRYAAGVPARPTAKTWLILDLDERNDNVVVGVIADNARLIVTLPDGTAVKGKNIEGVGIPPVSIGRRALCLRGSGGNRVRWARPDHRRPRSRAVARTAALRAGSAACRPTAHSSSASRRS